MTPSAQTRPAPSSTACGSPEANTWDRNGSFQASSTAAANPQNIPTPPRRGIGSACMSRSRTGFRAPTLNANQRTSGVAT